MPPPHRTLRGTIARSAALILAGATLNVLAAWAAVLWFPLPGGFRDEGVPAAWPFAAPASWPAPMLYIRQARPWASEEVTAWWDPTTSVSVIVRRYGLPLPSMEIIDVGGTIAEPPAVFLGPEPLGVPRWVPKASPDWQRWSLPLRPVWPATVLNSAIYAAALAALLSVPGPVLRRLRRARGRCPACGYDLAGVRDEQCPECGTAE